MLKQESFLNDQNTKAWEELKFIPRLHKFLPYESYDPEHKLFYNQGTTGFVLSGCPIVGASLNDQSTLAHFFTLEENLPEGCSIQFMLYASPRIQSRLSYWKSHRMPGIYQHLAEKRTAFLKSKAFEDQDGHLVRDFKLLISYTLPNHKQEVMERSQLLETRATFQNCLKQIGVFTDVMDDEGLINDLGDILNASHTTIPSDQRINPHEPLNRQILEPGRSFKMFEHGVNLGEGILAKSFIPSKAPPYWALGHMDKFLGDALKPNHAIPCPYILHYGLFVTPNQGREKSRLNTKREALE
ncbi:MAG: conjugal transfer protein TraC, partial [Caedimonadaceae bacterium]